MLGSAGRACTVRGAAAIAALQLVAWAAAPTEASAKEGFYIGVGLGYAVVDGDDNVPLEATPANPQGIAPQASCLGQNCVKTQFAEGLATFLRLGYNLFGVAAIDVTLPAHFAGLSGDLEWQAHFQGGVSVHPIGIATHVGAVADLDMWDPYVLLGGGFSYGGYDAGLKRDAKGWRSADLVVAAGLNIFVASFVSVGIDLRLDVPFYQEWIFNFDNDVTFSPAGTPKAVLFTPSAMLTFHPG